jgi:hypothetical protein
MGRPVVFPRGAKPGHVSFGHGRGAPARARRVYTLVVRPLPKHIEVIDEVMADVYRRKTSAQRLAIAHGMWRYARQRIEAAVRWRHPEWDDRSVAREVSRRLLNGSS